MAHANALLNSSRCKVVINANNETCYGTKQSALGLNGHIQRTAGSDKGLPGFLLPWKTPAPSGHRSFTGLVHIIMNSTWSNLTDSNATTNCFHILRALAPNVRSCYPGWLSSPFSNLQRAYPGLFFMLLSREVCQCCNTPSLISTHRNQCFFRNLPWGLEQVLDCIKIWIHGPPTISTPFQRRSRGIDVDSAVIDPQPNLRNPLARSYRTCIFCLLYMMSCGLRCVWGVVLTRCLKTDL